jgi:hypothetical protein
MLSSGGAEMVAEEMGGAGTEDLVTSVSVPASPGLYGNQYQLQLDISRLPRVEEYQAYVDAGPDSTVRDIPSDVKTVTYYVLNSGAVTSAEMPSLITSTLEQATDPTLVGRGLVRRELDRAVTQWAQDSGNATGLEQEGEVIAPEVVAIEFLYFDGLEWRTEWDSETEGALPLAVQVLLAIESNGGATAGTTLASAMQGDASMSENVRYYRSVVRLPTASLEALEESLMDESSMEEGLDPSLLEGTGL